MTDLIKKFILSNNIWLHTSVALCMASWVSSCPFLPVCPCRLPYGIMHPVMYHHAWKAILPKQPVWDWHTVSEKLSFVWTYCILKLVSWSSRGNQSEFLYLLFHQKLEHLDCSNNLFCTQNETNFLQDQLYCTRLIPSLNNYFCLEHDTRLTLDVM